MTELSLPLVSIAIPVLNEAANLDALYGRLSNLAQVMSDRCRLEFIFSDNHSDDTTWQHLTELAQSDKRVRAIRFSRNFGFQRSILANYRHARGDAVMQIDADLQDPPEMLEQFFECWQKGYQVVYGVRASRKEGWLISKFRRIGYWFIDKMSEHPVARDAGDFRLIDRKVVRALLQYRSSDPYLRGLISGMGFRQHGIPYARAAREAGESKFGLSQLIKMGFSGVFNHSVVPLRLASVAGLLILGVSAFGAVYYVFLRVFHSDLPRGLASVHILVLFGIGFQSLLLGVLGEYLLRIYKILRREPVAIIEDSLNVPSNELKL
jgi:glycosyltransferase involved in cell wall biosynthesis